MNHINPLKQVISLSTLTVSISILLIAGCDANVVKQEQLSETESCTRLQGLIKDHPNKFKNYKKIYMSHKTHSSWTADKLLSSAERCQVWEWSTGLNSYTCEWKVQDGESQAIANFEQATSIIGNCLGKDWTAKTNTTTSGGKHTVYSRSGSPTAVSIRYFHDTAGWDWLNKWQNTIVIGDKSNLNVPMQ